MRDFTPMMGIRFSNAVMIASLRAGLGLNSATRKTEDSAMTHPKAPPYQWDDR
jgi:hypothetical protein